MSPLEVPSLDQRLSDGLELRGERGLVPELAPCGVQLIEAPRYPEGEPSPPALRPLPKRVIHER